MHIDHLSFSSIFKFLNCPLQWLFSRLLEEEFVTADRVLGSALHTAFGHHYIRLKHGGDPSLDELRQVFNNAWKQYTEGETVRYARDTDENSILAEGEQMLKVFRDTACKDPIYDVEKPFTASIIDHETGEILDITLAGRIDLVQGEPDPKDPGKHTVYFVDWKTAKKKPDIRRLTSSLQSVIYAYAMRHSYLGKQYNANELATLFKFRYYIRGKSGIRYESFPWVADNSDFRSLFHICKQISNAIKQDIFWKNSGSWFCVNCGYKKACAKYPDIVDELITKHKEVERARDNKPELPAPDGKAAAGQDKAIAG